LRLLAEDSIASPTVTAAYSTGGLSATEIQGLLAERGVSVATGQGPLKDEILRIAHMGYCTLRDVDGVLNALQKVLEQGCARRAACPDSS
jgi:aspartate aminotransferase-like enzyme